MDVNQVVLNGRVGSPPQLREGEGVSTCSFVVGTDCGVGTVWHKVRAWGNLARDCKRFVQKGDRIFVFGTLVYPDWEVEGGGKKAAAEIQAMQVGFDSRRRAA